MFVFKNCAENKARRLVPDIFVFLKALFEVKTSGKHHSFNIFWQTMTWTYQKQKKCVTFPTVYLQA